MQACVSAVNDSEISQFKELFPNFGTTDKSKVWFIATS